MSSQDIAARRIQAAWVRYLRYRNLLARRNKVKGSLGTRKRVLKHAHKVFRMSARPWGVTRRASAQLSLKRFRSLYPFAQMHARINDATLRLQSWIRRVLLAKKLLRLAAHIRKMNNLVWDMEAACVSIQRAWLKHRYPWGMPKYRYRRAEAATHLQRLWRGHVDRKIATKRRQQRAVARAKAAAVAKKRMLEKYQRRVVARRNWAVIFAAVKLLVVAWRAQWTVVYKTEAARELLSQQAKSAAFVQQVWRQKLAKRYGLMTHSSATLMARTSAGLV